MQTNLLDEIYPHGRMARYALAGMDGYLLALQYNNSISLGKTLRALGGTPFWTPAENDRAAIWLSAEAALKLLHEFSRRLEFLSQFEIAETTQSCDKCRQSDVLYACGKFGYPMRLLCITCSRFASATGEKAITAREEAERFRNVLRTFRPIRKLTKPGHNLLKAA
jgi:hypothetical protein